MSTDQYFTAIFGSRRGRPDAHPDPFETEHEWIQRLFRHFAAAPANYIRGLAHLSLTALWAEGFCDWASAEAVEIAWAWFPQQTQTMAEDFDRAMWDRLSALDSEARCIGFVLNIAFCVIARDGLSSDQIDLVRCVLWATDPNIDRQLGQRSLNDW